MINTFEEKLAYDIGVKLAQQDYLEKEASMAAFKALGSGLKGVATGQGATMGQAFRSGVAQSGYTGAQGFRGVAKEIGQGLAKPWQQMYRRYGAGRVQSLRNAEASAMKEMKALERGGNATKQQLDAAGRKVFDAGAKSEKALQNYGGKRAYRSAMKGGYIPRTAEGAVNWGQVGTMATGAGLAGTGAYMAGNAAFGGGNTYNTNQYTTNVTKTAPQVAPHEYYMKQFSNWMNK